MGVWYFVFILLTKVLKKQYCILCGLILLLSNFLRVGTQAHYQQKIGKDFSSTRDLIFWKITSPKVCEVFSWCNRSGMRRLLIASADCLLIWDVNKIKLHSISSHKVLEWPYCYWEASMINSSFHYRMEWNYSGGLTSDVKYLIWCFERTQSRRTWPRKPWFYTQNRVQLK